MASLARSSAKVGSNTPLSRFLGFVNHLVVARVFGADAGSDAFSLALVRALYEGEAESRLSEPSPFGDDSIGATGAVSTEQFPTGLSVFGRISNAKPGCIASSSRP